MESLIVDAASYVALTLQAVAVLLVTIGAIEGVVGFVRGPSRDSAASPVRRDKEAFLRLAGRLLLGLEFLIAAAVVRSAVSPTWAEIGKLASIAAIRTALNYFLERDIERFAESTKPAEAPASAPETLSLNERATPVALVPVHARAAMLENGNTQR